MTWPVDRSAILGWRGNRSRRTDNLRATPSQSPAVDFLLSATGATLWTSDCGIVSGALLVLSEPPAMATSHSPRSMAAAASVIACRPEAQARVTVIASIVRGSPRSMTISRPTLGEVVGRMTPPHTTAPISAHGTG